MEKSDRVRFSIDDPAKGKEQNREHCNHPSTARHKGNEHEKIIAISSFKGGTAKTSTALHLGSAALPNFTKKKSCSSILMPKPI